MKVKVKRNDPCWCGSKKKYKKCHYAREQEERLSRGEAIQFTKSINTEKYCSAPESMKTSCTKRIIKAHSISKGGCLSEIADDTNHVLGIKPNIINIEKNNGKLTLEKIGVNKASTFTGFCSHHDNIIFSPIENNRFSATEEQCFLLAYRAIAREVYSKNNPEKFINQFKNSDKGMPLQQQAMVQALASAFDTNMNLEVKELAEYKKLFDQGLENNNYAFLKHIVIELEEIPPVMISSIVAPDRDFDGNTIQKNTDPKAILQYMMFSSFSSDRKGYVVFSWLNTDNVISGFIESLKKIKSESIFSALISFFFIYSENIYISPEWWASLSEDQQKSIGQKIHQGMFSLPEHCISNGRSEYGKFKIKAIKSINF